LRIADEDLPVTQGRLLPSEVLLNALSARKANFRMRLVLLNAGPAVQVNMQIQQAQQHAQHVLQGDTQIQSFPQEAGIQNAKTIRRGLT